jgi:dipeptidyl aminopeptidase/acylaminoacyl peptidase
MTPSRCPLSGLLALLLTAGWSSAFAVERLPVEYFAREPAANRAQLSPDGKHLAFLREYQGKASLHFLDIEKQKLSRLDLGEATLANDATKAVGDFRWIGNDRLVVTTVVWDNILYGVTATNWDGAQNVPISGFEDTSLRIQSAAPGMMTLEARSRLRETIHVFNDKDQSILMLDRHEGGGGSANRPDIMRVDTLTGRTVMEVKNPGEVARWGLDFNGVARLGVLTHGQQSGAIYRENADAPWRTILPLEIRSGGLRPLGFDAAGQRLLVAALNPENRWAVFPLDPATGTLGKPLLSDPVYDVVPEGIADAAGVGLVSALFSKKKQALVGIRYYVEAPKVKWLDRDYAGYQMSVDHAMPDTVNLLVGSGDEEKKLLWYAGSDQNPGEYFLLDVEKHKLDLLATRMPWVKPAQMAPMLSVKYTARDGLVIHGYLTVPVGHEPKDLPLVVLVHGGPWARDVWGFDPLVQLLANRGYAVLQVNYRGSVGYGEELYRRARRQIGREVQDDIEDGTRWAIAAGVADPKHIAIMGASYGGYSTLFGLGRTPELYRCGIAVAGVTDWPAFFEDSDIAEYKSSKGYWREQLGDPVKDNYDLKSISPVNFADKITAPVLIIQGKEDQRVPPDQARRMIAALEKAGRKPQSLFIAKLGHTYGNEKQRAEIFKAVADFLEKNLGPGVP